MSAVTFEGVSKRYGKVVALDTLDLEVREGEFDRLTRGIVASLFSDDVEAHAKALVENARDELLGVETNAASAAPA